MKEYQNMYNVATSNENTDDAIMRAYLLAGGDSTDYDWQNLNDDDRGAIKEYVNTKSDDILKKYFVYDNNEPSWNYKSEDLANMHLNTVGDRAFGWGDTYVKISQTNNGKVEKITLIDENDEGVGLYQPAEYTLTAQDGKYQSQTIYYYELPYNFLGTILPLSFGSDKELTTAQVKEKFEEILKKNPLGYGDDEVLALINGLTDNDKKTASESNYTDADVGKYFVSPRNLTMNLEVYGKQTGLQFSDFGKISGKFNINDKSYDRSYLFAGGYDIKSVDKADMNGEMKFKGNAVAQVMHHHQNTDGTEQSYLDLASTADLVFKDGAETLTMNFADNENPQNRWYNVRFESDADSETARMYLTDGDKIATENGKYKFTGADTAKTYELTKYKNESFNSDMPKYLSQDDNPDAGHEEEVGFKTTYYGDNGTPSEVSGKVSLLQRDRIDEHKAMDDINEVYFFGAFGAVRDK